MNFELIFACIGRGRKNLFDSQPISSKRIFKNGYFNEKLSKAVGKLSLSELSEIIANPESRFTNQSVAQPLFKTIARILIFFNLQVTYSFVLRLMSEVAYNLTFAVLTSDLIWHYCRINEMQMPNSRGFKHWQQIVLGAIEVTPK